MIAKRQLVPLRVMPSPATSKETDSRADVNIYRPFFLAGVLSVLTAGCLLGAIALFGIARQGSYTANVWTPYVLAHANSQLFGWVGFFIMGFALQQHAPKQSKVRLFHRLAAWSLGLMAAGIALRFAAEPLVAVDRSIWVPVGVFSAVLQLASVVLFNVNTSVTRYRSGEKMEWQTLFVFSSLFWLLVVSIAEPFVFAYAHQADAMAPIQFVAEYFAPLREAQFLGFVAMMIFGVALVKMNSCFGFRPSFKFAGLLGLAGWTIGLLMRMGGWTMAFRQGMSPESMKIYHLGGAALASSAFVIIHSLGIFEAASEQLRAHKFVRTAFGWLGIAGVLMALEPLHLRAIGAPFSHAYTGAIRHAVTVGFISQMILGVGLHVASRLNAVEDRMLPTLWAAFWLLNLGNAARVSLEILTDYRADAFMPMGVTGFVELTGLVIWGTLIIRLLTNKFRRSYRHAA